MAESSEKKETGGEGEEVGGGGEEGEGEGGKALSEGEREMLRGSGQAFEVRSRTVVEWGKTRTEPGLLKKCQNRSLGSRG